jgi:putative ABC transport system permease protein
MSVSEFIGPTSRWLPLRFALRELRSGLNGFYVFILCIALGSMAIAGVGSVAASLTDGLAREGRVILGGDLAFTLIQREIAPNERAFLQTHGQVSSAATLRAMARVPNGQATLVEMKAVDAAYPLFGQIKLDPSLTLANALAQRDGAFGAVADPTLMARLEISPGARLTIGNTTFEIRATLTSEPDKLAAGIGFGPRLLVSEDALRSTGLLQPGSLVRWQYRLRLPANDASDAAAKAVTVEARAQLPEAGWDIRGRSNASPQLERNVERFTQFLTIVGLTALLVGGVGVGNAVKSHLDRRRDTIATMKAPRGQRPPHLHDLPDAGPADGIDRRRYRRRARRNPSVRDFLAVRFDHSAAVGSGFASAGIAAGNSVRIADGACLRALAARTRA